MHIILGILGAIVTILILVNRLSDAGVDIGWLDPFKWHRRRKWKQKYNAKPIYSITDPMESTAVLMYTIVKLSGDISLEEKELLLEIFESDFQLSSKDAASLLSTCNFLVSHPTQVTGNIKKFIQPSLNFFTSTQIDSALELFERVLAFYTPPNKTQLWLFSEVKKLIKPPVKNDKWQ